MAPMGCGVFSVAAMAAAVSQILRCLAAQRCSAGAPECAAGDEEDAALLQRAVVQAPISSRMTEAERHADFIQRNSHDYDCNGDGEAECGQWNWEYARCANRAYCGSQYRIGDWNLGMSCRCRRCWDSGLVGTAFGDGNLQRPEHIASVKSWGTFRNWADHVDSCAPWLMPSDDAALRKLLEYAREKGYKVRIAGSAHSAGGLVTDGRDTNVFVISLAEYTAPGEWQFGLRDMPDGGARATANAGWTQADLFERIRPLGFFVPAQTAGYFFQLGGIFANSVHGGAYNRGFVHSYATRLRVMNYKGEIRIVDDDEEMRYWRNSYGLLGIILGIEFQLERRDHMQMYSVTKQLAAWNEEEFWKFIKQDAEADLPADIVPHGGAGSRASFNGEYFVEQINNPHKPTMAVYAQKANNSVDKNFNGELGTPSNVEAQYADLMESPVTDNTHGKMTWAQAARRYGAPTLRALGVDVNDWLDKLHWLPFAKLLSYTTILTIPLFVGTRREAVNDGFWLTKAPAAVIASYFMEPSKAFAALDYLRNVQVESLGNKDFTWNLPAEFRFTQVEDSAVLQPVPPGLWFAVEMNSIPNLAKNDQAWKRAFKVVEDYWMKNLSASVHAGKLWGFEKDGNGVVQPFHQSFVCTIYSQDQKQQFSEYRAVMDPEGLFATGLGMRMLEPCK